MDEFAEMIRANVLEGLGPKWLLKLERSSMLESRNIGEPVAIDGRMLPHEWVRVMGGYLKTDSTQHHDDHFFPGGQDIAWDLASCQIEFDLSLSQSRYLIKKYNNQATDTALSDRLPFYTIAYLAYRLGYTRLAANTLGDTDDGRRFHLLDAKYSRLLRQNITRYTS